MKKTVKLKVVKEELKTWRDKPWSQMGRFNIVKKKILPKFMYKFSVVPIKILSKFLKTLMKFQSKNFLEIILKFKEEKYAKTFNRKLEEIIITGICITIYESRRLY